MTDRSNLHSFDPASAVNRCYIKLEGFHSTKHVMPYDFFQGLSKFSYYFMFLLMLQGLVHRTGMGPRTGPDCNWFKLTSGPGPPNFFEKDLF